jgi:hypothetical protein
VLESDERKPQPKGGPKQFLDRFVEIHSVSLTTGPCHHYSRIHRYVK